MYICLSVGEPEAVSVAGFDNVPSLRSYVSGESTNRVYVDDNGNCHVLMLPLVHVA